MMPLRFLVAFGFCLSTLACDGDAPDSETETEQQESSEGRTPDEQPPTTQPVTNELRVDHNNTRNIALAMMSYATAHNGDIPENFADDQGNPLLSWRVRLLPYLDEGALYRKFHLDEPWDSEHNESLTASMPKYLSHLADSTNHGMTSIFVFTGDGTLFKASQNGSRKRPSIPWVASKDGVPETLYAINLRGAKLVEWTKPDDIAFTPNNPLKGITPPEDSKAFVMSMLDMQTVAVPWSIAPELLSKFITPAGGETITDEELDTIDRP